jgi:5'-nucleotidase (lipoprotein e(P4) family)
VIVDIDETMLDNSAFQVELLRLRLAYDEGRWREWVLREEARAVPGALEFARLAETLGVTVFYVSNRDAEYEAATRANLEALSFPLPADPDVVLLRGERPDWTSDKQSRRELVASSHRVLLMLGDDLNDFVTVRGSRLEERDALAAARADRFGNQWFVLPNPVYGSWLRTFLREAGGTPASLDQQLELLYGHE